MEPTFQEQPITRQELSAALKAEGYKVGVATLSNYAIKGTGPAFRKYG